METTRDLLHRARTYHEELAATFEELRGGVEEPQAERLLALLLRHENQCQTLLRELLQETDPAVLDAWFKTTPDHAFALPELELPEPCSVPGLRAAALRASSALGEVYRELAGLATSLKVREFFIELAARIEGQRDFLAICGRGV